MNNFKYNFNIKKSTYLAPHEIDDLLNDPKTSVMVSKLVFTLQNTSRIEELENEVKELENEIDYLERQIEDLEEE